MIPYHVMALNPGRPDSASVGISGAMGERCALLTAIARSAPDRTGGSPDTIESISSEVSPAISPDNAGADPL